MPWPQQINAPVHLNPTLLFIRLQCWWSSASLSRSSASLDLYKERKYDLTSFHLETLRSALDILWLNGIGRVLNDTLFRFIALTNDRTFDERSRESTLDFRAKLTTEWYYHSITILLLMQYLLQSEPSRAAANFWQLNLKVSTCCQEKENWIIQKSAAVQADTHVGVWQH